MAELPPSLRTVPQKICLNRPALCHVHPQLYATLAGVTTQAVLALRSSSRSANARSLCNKSLGNSKNAPSTPAVTNTNGKAAVSPVIKRIPTPPNTVITQMITPAAHSRVGASNTIRSCPAAQTKIHAATSASKNGIAVIKISSTSNTRWWLARPVAVKMMMTAASSKSAIQG